MLYCLSEAGSKIRRGERQLPFFILGKAWREVWQERMTQWLGRERARVSEEMGDLIGYNYLFTVENQGRRAKRSRQRAKRCRMMTGVGRHEVIVCVRPIVNGGGQGAKERARRHV